MFAAHHVKAKDQKQYVIEYRIPSELGGTSAMRNLWPEKISEDKTEDKFEATLHKRLCSGALTLAQARSMVLAAAGGAATTTTTVSTTTTTAPPPLPAVTAPPATAPPDATTLDTTPPETEPPQNLDCPNGSYTDENGNIVCSFTGLPPG